MLELQNLSLPRETREGCLGKSSISYEEMLSLSNQLSPGVQPAGLRDISVLQFDILGLHHVHTVTCPQKNKDAAEEAWMSFILNEPGKHRALHPHLRLC